MRIKFVAFLLLPFVFSCAKHNQFPEKKSIKIPVNELVLANKLNNTHLPEIETSINFTDLQLYVEQYNSKNDVFDKETFEDQWEIFNANKNIAIWNRADFETWIEITGLLLELTGEAKYGEELENISDETAPNLEQNIAPYILTKKLDHIYVNLFQPVELKYGHSMKGEVTFRQETNYPESGSVKLHFGMTERRHVELFIRIPSWAEGTSVTVKQVKYFAAPGAYCKIVKKWKEGDVVEIEFPIDNKPRK